MRSINGLAVFVLALLLAGGGALAQGLAQPHKVYLPLVQQPPTATAPQPPSTITPTNTATSTPTSTATTPPATESYDGVWSGTTAQQRQIGFTIANNELTSSTLSYRIGGCGATQTTIYGTRKPSIANGAFTLVETSTQVSPGGSLYFITITVQGSFSSTSAASGTLTVRGTACGGGETTWTATRGGAGAAPQPPTLTPTAPATSTPTATSVANPTPSAGVTIENLTGGPLSITLSGPTNLSTTVAPGEQPTLSVAPGTYVLTVTADCGVRTDVFSVAAGRTVGYTYRCVTVPAGAATLSQSIQP